MNSLDLKTAFLQNVNDNLHLKSHLFRFYHT